MKAPLKAVLILFATIPCFSGEAKDHQNSEYKIHILKEGETLSDLLYRENYAPLYGQNRWVQRILEANHLGPDQAKNLKAGRPVILPKRELIELDAVETAQAAPVSHGLFGNRISKHQDLRASFQYHTNSMNSGGQRIVSEENFGFFLQYKDKNRRVWKGHQINPWLEAGVLTHGTNRAQEEVLSYDPTFLVNGALALKSSDSAASFGPAFSLETASRVFTDNNNLKIRRDGSFWAGAFVSQDFKIMDGAFMHVEARVLKSLGSLNAIRNRLSLEVNLTRDYFLEVFSHYETYQNPGMNNSAAAGARLSYQLR